jgi:hypothetical protein
MEISPIQDRNFNLGKLENITSSNVTNIKNKNNIERIIEFLTVRESVCILIEVNKYFLKTICNMYKKDNSIVSCLKEMKSIIKQADEFKFITNNHCMNLEDNLKKFREIYNPFTFNRAVYVLSGVIFKEIQLLDLQKNNIGLDGVILLIPLLKKTNVLVNLNLAYNNISDDGSKFLAIAINFNKSLNFLNLECNGISDHGLASLSEPIVKHKFLKKIKMALNVVTLEGIRQLTEIIEKIESLIEVIDFHYNNIVLVRDEYQNDYFRRFKIAF